MGNELSYTNFRTPQKSKLFDKAITHITILQSKQPQTKHTNKTSKGKLNGPKDDPMINKSSAKSNKSAESEIKVEDEKYDDNDPISYKLHIAIDFGTDGIGLAYAIDGEVYVHQAFNSRKYGASVKPKTIVLLDEDGEVNSFGIDAKFTLSGNYFDYYSFCLRLK